MHIIVHVKLKMMLITLDKSQIKRLLCRTFKSLLPFGNLNHTCHIHKCWLVIASKMIDLFLFLCANEPCQEMRIFFPWSCIEFNETNMPNKPLFLIIINYFPNLHMLVTWRIWVLKHLKHFNDVFLLIMKYSS